MPCVLTVRSYASLQGEWGLHWPLINAPGSLSHSLAQKEFEQKRLEDAKR